MFLRTTILWDFRCFNVFSLLKMKPSLALAFCVVYSAGCRVGLQLPSCLLLSNLSSLTTVFIQYLLFLIFSVLDYHFGCAFLLNYSGHHRHHHHHLQHHHHQHHHHHHHHQHHHHHHRHHHHHHDHNHIIIITTTIIIIIKTMKSSSSSKLFSTRMDYINMLKIYETPRITSKARINVTRLFGIMSGD